MITNFIKIFSIIFCCFFTYNKLVPSLKNTMAKTHRLLLILVLTILSFSLNYIFKDLTYFISLLILWIITSYLSAQPQKSFIAVSLSFTISFCLLGFVGFILTFTICPLFPNTSTFPFEFLAVTSAIIQNIFAHLLCNTKRFKKSIPNMIQTGHMNFITILCVLLFVYSIFAAGHYQISTIRTFGLITTIIVLFFLIYWWQAQITKSYRRTLELRELESMRTEMAELKLKMQEVMEENEKLARITHRDNTLISTLKNSTVKYLMTDFTNSADAIATGEKLIANINALSAGRTSLPDNFNEKKARTFDTGIPLLDELLHQMDITAIENQITFSVHMGTILSDFVPAHVSSDDLVHTVDDLLKNAFKATKTCDKRVVQLQFYKLGKHFVIEVADSGIPFEVKSLVNMGMERLTTYDDGSGIGLVDIWNTKTKYGATYHIDEYAVATPFTKKISLTFDKKNRYSIRTWRKNEITQISKRADLQVYEDSE